MGAVTKVSTTIQEGVALGTEREEAGKSYKYAYTSAAIPSGRALMLASGATDFTLTNVTIAPEISGNTTWVQGVTQITLTDSTIPASSYFWAQTEGFCTLQQSVVSGAYSPDRIYVDTASGTVAGCSGTLLPGYYNYPTFGVSTSNGTTVNSGLIISAYINCQ